MLNLHVLYYSRPIVVFFEKKQPVASSGTNCVAIASVVTCNCKEGYWWPVMHRAVRPGSSWLTGQLKPPLLGVQLASPCLYCFSIHVVLIFTGELRSVPLRDFLCVLCSGAGTACVFVNCWQNSVLLHRCSKHGFVHFLPTKVASNDQVLGYKSRNEGVASTLF